MANLFLTGSGVPTNAVGEVSDYYRDTTTNLIYYRAALGWEAVPSLIPTPDGVGTNWLFGTGAPNNGVGATNDYYRDDANGSIYRKHAINGWEAKGSLDFIGVYGVQWGEGSGAPANIPSLNNLPAGSFYLDVVTSDIYYKDNTLTWSLKGQLGGGGGGGGNSVIVVDSLASTSATDALSANQGKVLKDEIDTKCPLVEGKVPSANLPSYVDDVLEYTNFASFPVTGETGKIYVDTSTDFVYRWSGSAYFQLGSSGGGSGIREDVTFTSGSIVANASVSGTVSISPRYQLLQITTNYPCRVRLYTSTEKRDADIPRPIGTDPESNHGLLFEFISSTELLSADLSPLVDGFADTAAIPYSLTNLSGATQTISVTLNHVKTGA